MIDNWTLGSIVYFAVVIVVSLKVSTHKNIIEVFCNVHTFAFAYEPCQANLCLRAFCRDKY